MKLPAFIANDPFFRKLLSDTDELSAQEYLKALGHPEKIDLAATKFIPPTLGEPGFGRFQVKWRHPWRAETRAK
ncbi:MAG: hypothetical protein OD918_08705 [Gammaproteobacteria bacterium]